MSTTNLRSLLSAAERPLLSDGAIGTGLAGAMSDAAIETGWPGAIELLNQERPEAVVRLHREYLDAGATVLTTNTFCASTLHYQRAGRREPVASVIAKGVALARRAINEAGGRSPIFVVGSCGPLPGEPGRRDAYQEQVAALVAGGVDAVLIETVYSLASLKDAWAAVKAEGSGLPAIVTYSPIGDDIGLEDASLDDLLSWVDAHELSAFGINCGDGGDLTYRALLTIRERYTGPLMLSPSAGLPQIGPAGAVYPLDPETWSRTVAEWVKLFSPVLVGGCCGTSPEHVRQLAKRLHTN